MDSEDRSTQKDTSSSAGASSLSDLIARQGREDWDFVSFDNYSSDMKQLSDQSASIIEQLRRERDEAQHMVGVLVYSAGGQIEVERKARFYAHRIELTVMQNDYNDTQTFKASLPANDSAETRLEI